MIGRELVRDGVGKEQRDRTRVNKRERDRR